MIRTHLVVALIAFASAGGSAAAHAQASATQEVAFATSAQVLSDALAQRTIGSAVGLVARGDEIVFLSAVGDISPGEPMPVNAIVRLASITKAVTAVAVLTLEERGALNLDDPVESWISGFGARVLDSESDTVAPDRVATVRDLLTHRAGLIPGGQELDRLWDAPTALDFARRIGSIPLRFQPGSRFEYGCCGSAYEVLAAIVEEISGQSFKDYVRASVLDPLQMTDTYFSVPESKRNRLAAHYGRDSSGTITPVRERGDEEPESAFYSGGGGLRSTVLDYHRLALMLLNGGELDGARVLSPENVQRMLANQVDDAYPTVGFGWGFGVRVRTAATEAGAGVGSFGWNGGTGTQFEVDPNTKAIVIVFAPVWPGRLPVGALRNQFISSAMATIRGW